LISLTVAPTWEKDVYKTVTVLIHRAEDAKAETKEEQHKYFSSL